MSTTCQHQRRRLVTTGSLRRARAGSCVAASAGATGVPRQAPSTLAILSHRASLARTQQVTASTRIASPRVPASAGNPRRASCAAGIAAAAARPMTRSTVITAPPAGRGDATLPAGSRPTTAGGQNRPAVLDGSPRPGQARTALSGTQRHTGPGPPAAASGPPPPAPIPLSAPFAASCPAAARPHDPESVYQYAQGQGPH